MGYVITFVVGLLVGAGGGAYLMKNYYGKVIAALRLMPPQVK